MSRDKAKAAESQRRYAARYPERIRASNLKYRATHLDDLRASTVERMRVWRLSNRDLVNRRRRELYAQRGGRTPLQALAHRATEAVRRAVQSGRLIRPSSCERCAKVGVIEAAHEDYQKRLDVHWLCQSCHRQWDAAQPKGGY